jgi:hypothetical protein
MGQDWKFYTDITPSLVQSIINYDPDVVVIHCNGLYGINVTLSVIRDLILSMSSPIVVVQDSLLTGEEQVLFQQASLCIKNPTTFNSRMHLIFQVLQLAYNVPDPIIFMPDKRLCSPSPLGVVQWISVTAMLFTTLAFAILYIVTSDVKTSASAAASVFSVIVAGLTGYFGVQNIRARWNQKGSSGVEDS